MAVSVFEMEALKDLWTTEEIAAIFSERARVQTWLDYEAALAEVQSELGLIPEAAAREIRAKANASELDLVALGKEFQRLKHSIVPVIQALERRCEGGHGEWVHYGPTTQDVIDTGMMLQLKRAHAIYKRDCSGLCTALAVLADRHRGTLMAGRTHGVQALPITFGHKCAIWLDEMLRHIERLSALERRVFVGSLVGAVGSQASLGPRAREIETRLMQRLGLGVPNISFAPARDRFVEYATTLGLIGGTLAKIANEMFNLGRNEIAEVEELFTAGKIGSSTMPHKRNPVIAENLIGLGRALRHNVSMMLEALVQEGERDSASWKAEWKALPEACIITGAMLAQATRLIEGVRVDEAAMRRNLDILAGYLLSERVMLALGEKVGKQTAHHWVYEASMRGIEGRLPFAAALRGHMRIRDTFGDAEIERLTDPATYTGECSIAIDRVLVAARAAHVVNGDGMAVAHASSM
jgi:adenylosuccinate lyase